MTPTLCTVDFDVYSDAYAALFDKIGSAIFVTHSQGGPVGYIRIPDRVAGVTCRGVAAGAGYGFLVLISRGFVHFFVFLLPKTLTLHGMYHPL